MLLLSWSLPKTSSQQRREVRPREVLAMTASRTPSPRPDLEPQPPDCNSSRGRSFRFVRASFKFRAFPGALSDKMETVTRCNSFDPTDTCAASGSKFYWGGRRSRNLFAADSAGATCAEPQAGLTYVSPLQKLD